jgi:hypothetical protein
MGNEEARAETSKEPSTYLIQIGRFELRGANARRVLKLVGYALAVLLVCVPGAMAFVAYAEGGTSLWAAIAFAVAVPGAVALWISREAGRVRRK